MADHSDAILTRMMALHPKVIDLTLDRVWRLLDRLENPQERLPSVIHIAGTNGKGSTQAMIRAGLEAAENRVHAYTSPHLTRFHERIRLAGTLISETELSQRLEQCYQTNSADPITYFEITTCAAIKAMAECPADFTLLEVGLGGRLDATNVVAKPKLCIITSISIDHQQFLGNTLPEIASEKAGIIKSRVPVIVGPQHEAALEVLKAYALRLHAPVHIYGQHWHVSEKRGRLIFQDEYGLLDLPLPNLPGAHQIQNAGTALAALRFLEVTKSSCEVAVTQAQWPARLQRLREGPLSVIAPRAELWLDGGHNPAAGHALAQFLSSLPKRRTYLICGMLKTKDIRGYLAPLQAVSETLFAVSIPNEVNTLSANDTTRNAAAVGFHAQSAQTVDAALHAISAQEPHARIVICGSLYLAGMILRENG